MSSFCSVDTYLLIRTAKEERMMLKKLLYTSMALLLVAATGLTSMSTTAEAYRGRRAAGIVAGTIIGLGILGAAAAARDRGYDRCYPGPRRCDVVGQRCHYNRYGEYVCRDDVRCYRPTVCD
jgi:hypothetical protein